MTKCRLVAAVFATLLVASSCTSGDERDGAEALDHGAAATTEHDSSGAPPPASTTTSTTVGPVAGEPRSTDDSHADRLAKFLDVSAGDSHLCGVLIDGTLTCWGRDRGGSTKPPAGTYSAVSSASDYSCALSTDMTARCWGTDTHGQTHAPDGTFTALSTGRLHACGVRPTGAVACWGADGSTEDSPIDSPAGNFAKVSAGAGYTCGLRADHSVDCWGENTSGALDVPDAKFIDVTATPAGPCALSTAGALVCWGHNQYSGGPMSMLGPYSAFLAESDELCAAIPKGPAFCWDHAHDRMAWHGGSFVALAISQIQSCGLRRDQTLICWGVTHEPLVSLAPSGEFVSVSVEELYSCAVRAGGAVACWGYEAPWWRGEVIPDDLVEVSVASKFACGIVRSTTGIGCWGRLPMGSVRYGEVLAIAPGDVNICAVLVDLKIDCSSDPYRGRAPVLPEGEYREISSGGAYFCAIDTEDAITCWEDDEGPGARFDITPAPIGEFVSVAAGATHACALKKSGTAECWGNNVHRQADPPDTRFVAIDVTDDYSCGVHHDGGIECWGAPFVDPSKIPQGTFIDVSTAPGHACALGADGAVACWFTHVVPWPEGVEWVWSRPNS